MALCEKLKAARKRLGQTQCSVSHHIGISNTALSNYETGYRQPDLDTLCQLAKFYRVSIDELVGVQEGLESPIDLWVATKEETVAFHGREYVLKDYQKRVLRRTLQEFFDKMEREREDPVQS